ncbi:hypothetical protein ACQPZX_38135 [Actinoplanes sp. CA-142083]|uniref:hypothetical protein n=1 Tax=Actinoplanes sp. CA-142083 TaxID=3239903 RepID=UPI003D8E0DE6
MTGSAGGSDEAGGTGRAAEAAAARVAAVRDDPAARLALAAGFYDSPAGSPGIRPYRRAEVAFMRWQISRGVLAAGGSAWWRAVNEGLIRDAWEAEHLVRAGERADLPQVERWVEFLQRPSPRAWYRAHNSSIVAGYLAHRPLADREGLLERFFMDVALLRVLYADSLLSNARLALGRFSPVGRWLGDPRRQGTDVFLSLRNILPVTYPLPDTHLTEILDQENYLGRLIDYGVILPRARRLYEHAARDLEQPGLLTLISDDFPAYAWPPAETYAWQSRRPRATRMVQRLVTP